jgi:hypothetical protein
LAPGAILTDDGNDNNNENKEIKENNGLGDLASFFNRIGGSVGIWGVKEVEEK